ncbi:MAG: sel1 repeat family protein [Alphaproteobacteria bacterium]|nr:sel1 repeat family protein [Alphaproteobacteria bacterium]
MKLAKYLILSMCALSSMPKSANATLQEALDALKEEDYTFAIKEFNRLISTENNEEARYQLALLYEQGIGLEENKDKALNMFKQAAQNGNEKAALKLGNAYYTGKGLEKNYADAINWYMKAAQKGNYAAQYNLGLMLEEGTGVKKNIIKAFDFYKKSADQGYEPAQYALGKMYLTGSGTPQDFMAAVKWHKLAADQGDFQAQMDLAKLFNNTSLRGLPFYLVGAHMYFNLVSAYGPSPLREEAAKLRDEVTLKMKPEEIQMAQNKAVNWKKKTRLESLPSLQDTDGLGNDMGASSQSSNKSKEDENIQITVKTDKETMLVAAGISRRDLNDAVKDNNFEQIIEKLTKKAEKGDVVAQLALGDLYMLGQGMDKNPSEALKWYQKAAEKNNAVALFKLAPMYCEGEAVEPDLSRCYAYVLKAKEYSDEKSLPDINETIKMLDENFELPIREAGIKILEDEKNADSQSNSKKGLFSNIKEKFSKKNSEEDASNETISKTETKEKSEDEIKSADDFFQDF